ncbi:transcriptional regulator [Calothrix parasitica NIES-267]|uniref:Transcriptional regulator n=1 Tax=Calothrix parasitica NIES-267 TaxID=1973488 RepID=A0A1Z4LYL2_9CYAN|nr:transcriptional regulator [Calothrix parasitica NIES-267]
MYSIGEYSRIAQVSKRLLRYYDEIGLFQPIKIDSQTGHRYYSASQLPELNRIIALKDLGLSLEQIRRFIKDDISLEEIQGMLLIKKAELEQQVLDELIRIRTIESRLNQIKDQANHVRDVVIKQVPQQKIIGTRKIISNSEAADNLFWSLIKAFPEDNDTTYGAMTIVLHDDGINGKCADAEMGRLLHKSSHDSFDIYDGITLAPRELPAETMATFIPPTGSCAKLLGYNAIGEWVEANHYTFVGSVRLVFLELPKKRDDRDFVTEIQFPVRKREINFDLSSIN